MLHMNVWKHKGLQSTVEVIVLGRARSSVSGVNLSALHLSQLFSTCRGSGNLLVQSESRVGILCEKVDQRRSFSALGNICQAFSASSTSPDSYQFHPDSTIISLSVPKLMASSSPFDCTKMAAFNSSAQLDVKHFSCPTINARQMVDFPASIKLSSRIKGLRCCSRVTANMKDQYPCGNNMLYRSFWSNTVGENSHSNPLPDHPGESEFHASSALPTSDVANDFPSDASTAEDQADNSTVSSEKKKPGERKLKLSSGSCYLPHPDKEETGGEDAHFICVDKQAIGVADGVGGWAELGVDAGLYARELMTHSVAAIEQEPKGSVDPSRVLEKAYLCTKARGSSTACIIALTDEQGIHAVNLGDSGFIVVRDGCTVFRSPVQQHDFNFTYQLECGQGSDLPSSAQVFNFPVAPGDVIVAGTDGLFDNLYNNEVTAVVLHAIRAGLGPQVTAQKIAALARQRAQDKNRQTPFSTAAQDAGYRYYGGKLDDITVVVSYVATSEA